MARTVGRIVVQHIVTQHVLSLWAALLAAKVPVHLDLPIGDNGVWDDALHCHVYICLCIRTICLFISQQAHVQRYSQPVLCSGTSHARLSVSSRGGNKGYGTGC
jgi:hypothetical protein